jgi:TetR/AcrR family transcriptional repressor of nem operon
MSRRDIREIREKLLDEGVLLLMEQGYHGTGLQELVQNVGVPKGSFYNGSSRNFVGEFEGEYGRSA